MMRPMAVLRDFVHIHRRRCKLLLILRRYLRCRRREMAALLEESRGKGRRWRRGDGLDLREARDTRVAS